jgi:hypothetical protein
LISVIAALQPMASIGDRSTLILGFPEAWRRMVALCVNQDCLGDRLPVAFLLWGHMLDAFVDGMTPLDREATSHIIAELRAIGERLEKAAEAMEQ